MILRKLMIFSILVLYSVFTLSAADFFNGNIRLSLNEKRGSISLYYMTDANSKRYEPLFYSREPKSSYISVNLNGTVYRLDQSGQFKTRTESIDGNPIIIYESSDIIISEIFTPVKTVSSYDFNGINITIVIQNKRDRAVSVGLRFLIDTYLGEERKSIPISTSNQSIVKETVIEGSSGEKYWISRNNNLSLMGSIVNPLDKSAKIPDYIHIANWRRFHYALWKLKISQGRSFSILPYSVRDSAVCYYYEPAMLEADKSFTYSILLTTEDTAMYDSNFNPELMGSYDDSTLQMLYKLKKTLEQFIAGDIILYENDLDDIENSIDSHKKRQ